MIGKMCPHKLTALSPEISEIQAPLSYDLLKDEVRHMVDGIQGNTENYTPREEKYREYARLIASFFRDEQSSIVSALDNSFQEGIGMDEYRVRLYTWFHMKLGSYANQTYNLSYGKLDSGIGTMLMIITSLRGIDPSMTEPECIKNCRTILQRIGILDIPDGRVDIKNRYLHFAKQYLAQAIPQSGEKTAKLFCPAGYTQEGNELIKAVIGAFYKHFPINTLI